ncbi:hypothetical protein Peur_021144 [Populus x canadensis]
MDFLLLLSTHVGLCWPFVLFFAASVPVFSPSFASGFGGLFNGLIALLYMFFTLLFAYLMIMLFFFLCYFGLCCLAFDHGASVVTFSFLPLCMIYWSFIAYA